MQVAIRPNVVPYFSRYLNASPLPPAPLAVAGFMVAGLAAWQYSDRLAGLLVLLSGFCFASTLGWSVCWLVRFWMLVSMQLFWYLQLPRYSP